MPKLTILQLLPADANRLVYGMFDDNNDKYLAMCLYAGAVSTLPTSKEMFSLGCGMWHKAEQNIYINVAADGLTPVWHLSGGASVQNLPALLNKGDLITDNGTNPVIAPVGANGYTIVADSSSPNGWAWKAVAMPAPVIVDTNSGTSGGSTASSATLSLDSSGLNRTALVQVIMQQNRTISAITYNGVAMTLAKSQTDVGNNIRVEQYYLSAPALGTHNVSITFSGATFYELEGQIYTDTNQVSPIGTVQGAGGSTNHPTLTLVTGTDNSQVVDGLGTAYVGTLTAAPGAGQSLNGQNLTGSYQGSSSVQSAGSQPDAVVMDYALNHATPWVYTAIELKGIPPVTAGVQSVTGLNTDNTDPQNPVVEVSVDGTTVAGAGTPGDPLRVVGSSGSGGTTVQKDITQTAHTFSVDEIIRSSDVDGEFTRSQADVATNADVVGIVSAVPDVDHFTVITEGFYTMSALPGGAVAGDDLFLSDTVPGDMTTTEPTASPTVSKPIAVVIDASTKLIYFHNYRGQENQTVPAGITVFENGNDSKNASDASAIQTIPHNLPATPTRVRIVARAPGGFQALQGISAETIYNGTTQSSQSLYGTGNTTSLVTTFTISDAAAASGDTTGIVTFDATNIYINWTKTLNPTGIFDLLWEAQTQI